MVRLDQPLMVASGFTSHQICSESFVTGLNPDQVFAERVQPTGAIWMIGGLIHYRLERDKQEVRTTVAGGFKTRAVYRDGMGCTLVPGNETVEAAAQPESAPRVPAAAVSEIAGADRLVAEVIAALQPEATAGLPVSQKMH